uniref:Uncharacterized protein n=1 Tax=Anguilla anguilla TaxID=7936 RepID=A0A0E9QVV5_ANGAN
MFSVRQVLFPKRCIKFSKDALHQWKKHTPAVWDALI